MAENIIKIQKLGKKYSIGGQEPYLALRDQFSKILNFRSRPKKKDFWALKGVDLEIKKGEILGIIGPNGAGKSTLLKILSRITPPTEGKITMAGRVASLLEVGTGFHPELTGRENIFLNGTILGMRQKEIKEKFNQIVDFAEIAEFLDTPVKRYSSGMYVRLAFAVAAHLEPEILIIDEVLAVGDAQFQKKCLGKMGQVARSGRTIIFVSHNMAAVNELCQKCVLLEKGKIVAYGRSDKIIARYLARQSQQSKGVVDLKSSELRRNSLENSAFKFREIQILNSKNKPSGHLAFQESFSLLIKGHLTRPINDLKVAFSVDSPLGFPLFNSFNIDGGLTTKYNKGEISFLVDFPSNILAPGAYNFSLGANGEKVMDWIPQALTVSVGQVSQDGKNINPDHGGVIVYPCKWSIKK